MTTRRGRVTPVQLRLVQLDVTATSLHWTGERVGFEGYMRSRPRLNNMYRLHAREVVKDLDGS